MIIGRLVAYLVPSRAGHEKLLIWLAVGFVGSCVAGYVLHELAAALRTFAFDHAHAAGGHGAGFESENPAFAHLNVRAKPVGAKHSSRGVEGHGSRDGAFEILISAGENPPAHLPRPGHAA